MKHLLVLLCSLWLVACGGGGSGNESGPSTNQPTPQAPQIELFETVTVSEAGRVTLRWRVTDADTTNLSCTLTMTGATPTTHNVNNCRTTTQFVFTVPENGSYTAQLSVTDNTTAVNDTLTVTVTQIPAETTSISSMKIYYLHSSGNYNGWGLHLWGNSVDPDFVTTWQAPMPPTRIEQDYAYWEVPIVDENQIFSFIVHYGDLKSPNYDLIVTPATFGDTVWVTQDRVAEVGAGITAVPFATEAQARDALAEVVAAQGNASAVLDFAAVSPIEVQQSITDDWHRNANFMEIYVRGYQDSDGDGVGDFVGLTERLPYLADLGITALWLMPIMESADNDHGYETVNYRDVESDYGTLADFQRLLDVADDHGIAIVIDYVMNHAASQNPLFLDAASSPTHSLRDWFIWGDRVDNAWQLWGRTPWRQTPDGVYYGAFTERMPDFNLRNQAVLDYHKDSMRFWLNMGVDGFRFDAVGVLVENGPGRLENQPENLTLMGEMAQVLADYPHAYIVCEAPGQFRDMARTDTCVNAFNFSAGHMIIESVKNQQISAGLLNELAHANRDQMPMILANHDYFAGDRVFNQLNGDMQRYRLAASLYLLLSAQPYTYYGEEIGMAAGPNLQPDASLRTPMSWNNDATHAGFSSRTPFRRLSANFATHNVAIEMANNDSLYHWYRQLYALRSAHPTIANGTLQVLSQANQPVLAVTRSDEQNTYMIVVNVSAQTRNFIHSINGTSSSRVFETDEVNFAPNMTLPAGFVGVWQIPAQ
jgi:glycosidase